MFSDILTMNVEKNSLGHNLLKISYVFIFNKVSASRKYINPKCNKKFDKRQNLRPWLKYKYMYMYSIQGLFDKISA